MSQPYISDSDAYHEGVVLFKEGKLLQALSRFRYAATHGEERPLEHFALATVAAKLGEFEEAVREYRLFLSMNSGLPQQEQAAHRALAELEQGLMNLRGQHLAQVQAEAAQHESEAQAEARAQEAKRLEEAQEQQKAERTARVRKVRTLFEEALAFYRVGGYPSCLTRLAQLEELWGRTEEVLNLMGLAKLGAGFHDEAVTLFEEAVRLVPGSRDPVVNLARAHYERGCVKAGDLLEDLVARAPDFQAAWFNLGIVREAKSDLDGAVTAFQKAVHLDPADQQAKAHLDYVKRRLQ